MHGFEHEPDAPGAAREQAAGPGPAPPGVDLPPLGNKAIASLMGGAAMAPSRFRAVAPPTLARQPAPAADPAQAEQGVREAEEFVRGGVKRGTVTPGDGGNHGGFDAVYDPAAGLFTVQMKVAVKFTDAVDDSLAPALPGMQAVADRIRPLRGARRARELAKYQWARAADAPEKLAWCTQLKQAIDTGWSDKHEFHLNKPGWEWIGARVLVDIDVHPGPKAGDDHMEVETVKMPSGENLYTYGESSATGEGDPTNAFDQSMTIASTDVTARPDNALRQSIQFPTNVSSLNADQEAELESWRITFNGAAGPAGLNMPVAVTGHASAAGSTEHNQRLSEERAQNVTAWLTAHGFRNVSSRVTTDARGEEGAGPGDRPQDRRVDLVVGDGNPQNLAMHEFGHAFGLGDEYATDAGGQISGTGGNTGDPATHNAATQAMQDASGNALPGAVTENTDSIMSMGNVIRPQHYSTFHTALTEITGQDPWALGPPGPKPTMSTPTGPAAPAGGP